MRASELSGPALDYAVALAEKRAPVWHSAHTANEERQGIRKYRISVDNKWDEAGRHSRPTYAPTTSPAGDDIIDRHRISVVWDEACLDWGVQCSDGSWVCGATRREAAMRAYVVAKLGDDVDIPKELL